MGMEVLDSLRETHNYQTFELCEFQEFGAQSKTNQNERGSSSFHASIKKRRSQNIMDQYLTTPHSHITLTTQTKVNSAIFFYPK